MLLWHSGMIATRRLLATGLRAGEIRRRFIEREYGVCDLLMLAPEPIAMERRKDNFVIGAPGVSEEAAAYMRQLAESGAVT